MTIFQLFQRHFVQSLIRSVVDFTPNLCYHSSMDHIRTLAEHPAVQDAIALLLSGMSTQQVGRRISKNFDFPMTTAQLDVLEDLVNTGLVTSTPAVSYRPDGHVDLLREIEHIIPLFKGQLHTSFLAAKLGSNGSNKVPDMLMEYAKLLRYALDFQKAYGVRLADIEEEEDDAPTLSQLLESPSTHKESSRGPVPGAGNGDVGVG